MYFKKRITFVLAAMIVFTSVLANVGKDEKEANKQFQLGNFREALSYYKNVESAGVMIKEKIADCYYYLHEYGNAEMQFEQIIDEPAVNVESYYYYADVLMNNGNYTKAKKYFEKYQSSEGTRDIAPLINSCQWAQLHKDDRPVFGLKPLNIETGGKSLGIALYKDGIIYSRPQKDEFAEQTVYYDLAFITKLDSMNFSAPEKVSGSLVSRFYEGSPSISSDRKYMYYTRNASNKSIVNTKKKEKNAISSNGTNVLEIVVSEFKDDAWQEAVSLSFNSIEYSCTHPAISSDGKTLIFVSNQPGGLGGYDIYKVEKKGNVWGKPINLGPTVNTSAHEMFPTLYKEKLYFSTKGRLGYGGFDVMVSDISGNTPTEAKNVGIGINSSKDDFEVVFNKDGKTGYISTNREGENGYDKIYSLYKIIYAETISAQVRNKISSKPIPDASVKLIAGSGDNISSVKTDKEGKISFELYPNRAYKVTFSKEGYQEKSIEIPIGENRKDVIAYLGNIEMDPEIKKDVVINLDNIYFDYAKADLRSESFPILDRLVTFLNENPSVRIELSAHTDSRSSATYNLKLSQKRAQSCYKYLLSKSISFKRIVPKGYGESRLLNKCKDGVECSEAEHQLNRRVEIKIL